MAVDLPAEIMITSGGTQVGPLSACPEEEESRAKITPPGHKPVPDSRQMAGRARYLLYCLAWPGLAHHRLREPVRPLRPQTGTTPPLHSTISHEPGGPGPDLERQTRLVSVTPGISGPAHSVDVARHQRHSCPGK